jgi:hypothetical protein
MWRVLFSIMLALHVHSLSDALCAQETNINRPEKAIIAIRTDNPPKVDGVLDDEVWKHAPIATEFTQRSPNEGEPATERTTIQIAYDDEAVYAGILACDSEPERIITRLYRRDGLHQWESDWVGVSLDPHHDHQTGNYFFVGASGALKDGIIYNDDAFDATWDGVWQARTAIHDKGWTVEYRIPYHVLRFSQNDKHTWGINVERYVGRKHEHSFWVMVPKSEKGWASRFGHLDGIKGIHPPEHVEFLPFTLGRATLEPGGLGSPDSRELLPSAGLDLRYGLSTNFSLSATVNPDFGQVEADPAVLNLSVFETFFEERRPFFVEGSPIFSGELFYSRRIGKLPGHFSIPFGVKTIERPDATTILGAVKLTGKTASKTSIGILTALTAPEHATIEEIVTDPATGLGRMERREHLIEPLTSYFVGRVQQDVLKGNSRVGFITTAANRKDAESAYVGAMDWSLKLGEGTHQFSGTLGASLTGTEERSGWLTHLAYDKTGGWFRSSAGVSMYSPDFDANDLGYIPRANWLFPRLSVSLHKERPWGPFRQLSLVMDGWGDWGIQHEWAGQTERWINLSKTLDLGFNAQFSNFWRAFPAVYYSFEGLDDLDTRGGPLIVKPANTRIVLWVGGDARLSVIPDLWLSRRADVNGENPPYPWKKGSISWESAVGLRIKPASNAEFYIKPSYNRRRSKSQWVQNIDDDGNGVIDHFVYGELKSHTFGITTRAAVTFTPDLSLQFYMQPFVATGDYSNFRELARPSSYEFTPYIELAENPDFSRRSLRSNLVFRWEYRPGSTLFLVWSQSLSASLDTPSFHPWDSMIQSFSDEGQNIFLLKLNYWLGM